MRGSFIGHRKVPVCSVERRMQKNAIIREMEY
jgi:hypothetical protein